MNSENSKEYVVGYFGNSEYKKMIQEFVEERFKEEGYTVKVIDLEDDLADSIPNCIVYDMDEVSTSIIKEYAENTELKTIMPITKDKIITPQFAEEISKEIWPDGSVRISPTNVRPDEKGNNSNWDRFLNSTLTTRIIGHCERLLEEEHGNMHALQMIIDNFFDVIDKDSSVTKVHSEMVGLFNKLLAKEMNWDYDAVQMAEIVGKLHDIGKANGKITEEVNKGEPTTPIQQSQINEHSAGADVLDEVLPHNALIGATLHHSRHSEIIDRIKKDYEKYKKDNEEKKTDEVLTEEDYIQNHLQDYAFVSITRTSDVFNAITAYRGYNNPMGIVKSCLEMYKSATVPNRYGNIQLELNSVEALLVLLAKQVGSIGYDLQAMINTVKENDEFKEYYEKEGYSEETLNKVFEVFDKHKGEISINHEAKEGEFCEAGFNISSEGLLIYKNSDIEITYEKRLEATWNKIIMDSTNYNIKKDAKDFEEVLNRLGLPSFQEWQLKKSNNEKLEESKEVFLEECLEKAKKSIDMEDKIARECLRTGKKQSRLLTPVDIENRAISSENETRPTSFRSGVIHDTIREIGSAYQQHMQQEQEKPEHKKSEIDI